MSGDVVGTGVGEASLGCGVGSSGTGVLSGSGLPPGYIDWSVVDEAVGESSVRVADAVAVGSAICVAGGRYSVIPASPATLAAASWSASAAVNRAIIQRAERTVITSFLARTPRGVSGHAYGREYIAGSEARQGSVRQGPRSQGG